MTNKELSAAVRRDLKKAGYAARDFSVSVRDCGYSESIRVKIKNPEINRKDIEGLLRHYEEFERDERTGEILEGGNTYLFINYEDGIFDEKAQEWAATAKGVFGSGDEVVKIFNGLYLIRDSRGNLEILQDDKNDHCRRMCWSFESLCVFIYKFAKFGTIAA